MRGGGGEMANMCHVMTNEWFYDNDYSIAMGYDLLPKK
jgi:hypothetical protein